MTTVESIVRPLYNPRSYLALLYGLMRFPLAIAYLVIVVTLLSIGLSTILLGFGLIALFTLVLLLWVIAIFERELGGWWFGFQLRALSVPAPPGTTIWKRAWGLVVNPVTWRALAFVLIEVVDGLIAPFLLLAGATVALALLLAPLAAAADGFDHRMPAGVVGGLPAILAAAGGVPGWVVLTTVAGVGALAWLLTLHAAEIHLAGQRFLVETLLGLSDAEVQVRLARKEAATQQARAERSEQSRRELIVNASHELRTPVASIRGHVDALLDRDDMTDDGEARRYLEVVRRETDRLGTLIDDLMAVARAEAGELRLDVRPTDVGASVERVASALAPIADRDRHVKLVTHVEPGLPAALADPDRLHQVLLNLVRNAITYTPEGGLVAVEAAPAGPEHVVLTVADTGVGMQPEELERLFERFYRTDESRSRATGGFGLGLSISRDLVSAMGGKIEVESKPGEGSRFLVRLRRAA